MAGLYVAVPVTSAVGVFFIGSVVTTRSMARNLGPEECERRRQYCKTSTHSGEANKACLKELIDYPWPWRVHTPTVRDGRNVAEKYPGLQEWEKSPIDESNR